MKRTAFLPVFILAMLFSVLSSSPGYGQNALPAFKNNVVPGPDLLDSALRNDVKNFDLIIAYGQNSTWYWGHEYHLLVLYKSHWKKYYYKKFKMPYPNFSKDTLLLLKESTNAVCERLYKALLNKKLLTIEDDRAYPSCPETDTVIDGKVMSNRHMIMDAGGYNIWIIAHDRSRDLNYYAPDFFYKYCPAYGDRRYALAIIKLWDKQW